MQREKWMTPDQIVENSLREEQESIIQALRQYAAASYRKDQRRRFWEGALLWLVLGGIVLMCVSYVFGVRP